MYNETGLIVAMVVVAILAIGTVVCSVKKIDVDSELEIFMMHVLWKLPRWAKWATGAFLALCMAFSAYVVLSASIELLSGAATGVHVSITGLYILVAMVAVQVIDSLLNAQKKSLDVRTELV